MNERPEGRTGDPDFLIFVDDHVFLQHAVGLIFLLATRTELLTEVVIADSVDASLSAFRILLNLQANGRLVITKAPMRRDYKKIFSQWGPPPGWVRTFSKIRHNRLAFQFRNAVRGTWVCLPHGFEIKENPLPKISYRAKLRACVTQFSLNPYADYRFYDRYCLDSAAHEARYGNLLAGVSTLRIGSPTFNIETLTELKRATGRPPEYGKLVIMPKQRHVEKIGSVLEKKSSDILYVPHPREYVLQIAFLAENGVAENQIIASLDLMRIGNSTEVYDFGTSVSLVAKVSGASLHFENLTGRPLLVDPQDPRQVGEILRGDCPSGEKYSDFILEALIPEYR